MARLFTMIGALLGMAFIPLASIAGGFCAVLAFGFDRAYFMVNRDVLSDKGDLSP
jgi:hypothetical protein